MNKLKRIGLLLILCISILSINNTIFLATEYVDGYLRYTVEDDSVTITGYNGRESEVTIPSKIAGVPVNTIASGAFENVKTVTKVNLPDTIMEIEEGAFTVGQMVVYNSNTNDKVEIKPSEGATEETTKEPNKEQVDESNKTPSKETAKDEIKESNKETPKDKNKESSKNETTKTTNKTEEDFSVEEVEVDLDNLGNENTKNTESISKVSEDEIIQNTESDSQVLENEQNTELNDDVSQKDYLEDATTEVLTTVSNDTAKESTKSFPVIFGIVIGGIIVIVGVLTYKKKG